MTRRTLLGSMGAVTMFPQLAAGVNALAMPALEIGLRLGEPHDGNHGRRRALVLTGVASGSLMEGTVQAGRVEWLVDPASGAAAVAIDLKLVRTDGVPLQLRDRTAHADVATAAGLSGMPTTPELLDAAGVPLPAALRLAGRLDVSGLGRGVMWLRAFHPG